MLIVISATYVLAVPDEIAALNNANIILSVDNTSTTPAAITITLPAISAFGVATNVRIVVNDTSLTAATYNITVTCNASDKINNAASVIISQNGGTANLTVGGPNDWICVQSNAGLPVVANTATSDGLTTGIITNGNCFVNVTSASANNIIVLPAPIPGTRVDLFVGATGFELRTSAPATIAINGGTGTAAESAIGANVFVQMMCVSATAWIGRQYSTAGVQTAVEVAAP